MDERTRVFMKRDIYNSGLKTADQLKIL